MNSWSRGEHLALGAAVALSPLHPHDRGEREGRAWRRQRLGRRLVHGRSEGRGRGGRPPLEARPARDGRADVLYLVQLSLYRPAYPVPVCPPATEWYVVHAGVRGSDDGVGYRGHRLTLGREEILSARERARGGFGRHVERNGVQASAQD
ncbi:hypothetical protein BV20DRAFT_644506 [Pilatotrama ljubarskyi]|nr:hypothetical protein BV20DRAFT_644506 [Pilatotrama ljubarskyi]